MLIKLRETQRQYKENTLEIRKAERIIDRRTRINSLTKYWFMYRLKNSCELYFNDIQKSITVIFIDWNNLKDINERFGHDVWQESIFKTWKVLKKFLEEEWFEYRLSNITWWDERVIAILDTSKKKVEEFLKKAFKYLDENEFLIWEQKLKLSVTAWVVYLNKSDKELIKDSIETLSDKFIKISDILCLRAKRKRFTSIRALDKRLGKTFGSQNLSAKEMIKIRNQEEEKVKNKSIYIIKNLININLDDETKLSISTLPKKRTRKSLMKLNLNDLRALRFENRERLKRARTSKERNILNENLILLNFIIREKMYWWFYETLEKLEEEMFMKIEWIKWELKEIDTSDEIFHEVELEALSEIAKEENNELALKIIEKFKNIIDENTEKLQMIRTDARKIENEIKNSFAKQKEEIKNKK